MRSEQEIWSLVLQVAEENEHIRAVLLSGSRANPNAVKDRLQDFDIIYLVTELDTFIQDHHWIDVFGERSILQLPDRMTIGERDEHAFHYLMLFTDHNRIDLTLFSINSIPHLLATESLLQVLLDKDNRFLDLPPPSSAAYNIQPPTRKHFEDCCNEFWWVSTYVAKALWRKEIIYAKEKLEGPVRSMFLQMVEWHIGVNTNFTVAFGKNGRNAQRYLSPELYHEILLTYPDSNNVNIRNALLLMTKLFEKMAIIVANTMSFSYNEYEADKARSYLNYIYTLPQNE